MAFLTDIPARAKVMVENTSGQLDTYKMLMAYGIFKGSELTVVRNDQWQEMMLVEVNGKRIAIRKKDASPVEVIRLDEQ